MIAPSLPPPLPPPLPSRPPSSVPRPAVRSSFLNVTAWMTVWLCAIGLLFVGFQAALLAAARGGAFDGLRPFTQTPDIASLLATLSRWLPWFLALSVLICVLGLVAARGILKRREWARRLFVGLLAFSVVFQVLMIPLQWSTSGTVQKLMLDLSIATAGPQPQLRAQMEASMLVSQLMGAAFGLVFAGLYAWLAWKLCTPAVRAEFGAPQAPSAVKRF